MTRNAILFHWATIPSSQAALGFSSESFAFRTGGTKCRVNIMLFSGSRSCTILEPTVICPAVHVMSNASNATNIGCYRGPSHGKKGNVCSNLAPLEPVLLFVISSLSNITGTVLADWKINAFLDPVGCIKKTAPQ